jgi:hypothetical protein
MRPAISLVCVNAASWLVRAGLGAFLEQRWTRHFAVPLLLCCCEPRIPGLSAGSPIPAVGRVAPLADQPGEDAVLCW